MDALPPLVRARLEHLIETLQSPIVHLKYNTACQPIAQSHLPQCGLAALSMAHSTLVDDHSIQLAEYLNTAKTSGFTNHGEMFSGDVP